METIILVVKPVGQTFIILVKPKPKQDLVYDENVYGRRHR